MNETPIEMQMSQHVSYPMSRTRFPMSHVDVTRVVRRYDYSANAWDIDF